MRTLLKTPTVVDDYFQTEAHMWHALKSGPFCFNIVQCARRGVPLCVADWLRMVLLIPFSLSMNQLIRVFEEEDTMTALTSVRSPVALNSAIRSNTCHHPAAHYVPSYSIMNAL